MLFRGQPYVCPPIPGQGILLHQLRPAKQWGAVFVQLFCGGSCWYGCHARDQACKIPKVSGRPGRLLMFTSTRGRHTRCSPASDLSGSTIRSINTGSGCKRIAVFSGSGKISIGCSSPGSSDNLYQQMYPTATWGKTYLTVLSVNQPNFTSQYNYLRIFKSNPAATVRYNGNIISPLSFVNDQYVTLPATNQPGIIESDMPIMVASILPPRDVALTEQRRSGNDLPEPGWANGYQRNLNSMQPSANTGNAGALCKCGHQNIGGGAQQFQDRWHRSRQLF